MANNEVGSTEYSEGYERVKSFKDINVGNYIQAHLDMFGGTLLEGYVTSIEITSHGAESDKITIKENADGAEIDILKNQHPAIYRKI